VPLVRARVVTFRPRVRIAVSAARRSPRFTPGVLIRLDGRRISRRRPVRSGKVEWFVIGSAVTLLLSLFVKLLLP
jgi:hypothetical protein